MEKNNFLLNEAPPDGGAQRDTPPDFTHGGERMPRQDLSDNHSSHGTCGCCHGHEGCGPESWGLSEYPPAMVYSPCQIFRALYDPDTALHRGTLFTELDLPLGGEGSFTAEGCACRRERRRT